MALTQELHHPASSFPDITRTLRDFYDHYPYPPPVDGLENYRRCWEQPQQRRADFHLFWPACAYREDQSILVAGCGTSQAAKHALRWPAAQVTGIDISTTSVDCTNRLKAKYALGNLQVHQLAIERVDDLRMSFDQIVCTGVLHHLADPLAGLRALRKALKPHGAMHLMVYAPYGRAGIYMLQEFCQRLGIRATDGATRELVAVLAALPSGHPLKSLVSRAADFQNEAALADALLHPQDRAYSVPQLFDFLAEGGVTFGRWLRQAPYSVQCGVIAKIPQASRITSLSLKDQYSAIELFRGTMVRHSFIAYGNNEERGHQQIDFTGQEWLGYVPIRMLDTICVRDRLPPGAVAVLINRTHTDTDLFLPMSSTEKLWFDAVDGIRSIAEIVRRTASPARRLANLGQACTFFERLWWHDQVVFDTHPSHFGGPC